MCALGDKNKSNLILVKGSVNPCYKKKKKKQFLPMVKSTLLILCKKRMHFKILPMLRGFVSLSLTNQVSPRSAKFPLCFFPRGPFPCCDGGIVTQRENFVLKRQILTRTVAFVLHLLLWNPVKSGSPHDKHGLEE